MPTFHQTLLEMQRISGDQLYTIDLEGLGRETHLSHTLTEILTHDDLIELAAHVYENEKICSIDFRLLQNFIQRVQWQFYENHPLNFEPLQLHVILNALPNKPTSYVEEALPYIKLIKKCIKRNQAIADTKRYAAKKISAWDMIKDRVTSGLLLLHCVDFGTFLFQSMMTIPGYLVVPLYWCVKFMVRYLPLPVGNGLSLPIFTSPLHYRHEIEFRSFFNVSPYFIENFADVIFGPLAFIAMNTAFIFGAAFGVLLMISSVTLFIVPSYLFAKFIIAPNAIAYNNRLLSKATRIVNDAESIIKLKVEIIVSKDGDRFLQHLSLQHSEEGYSIFEKHMLDKIKFVDIDTIERIYTVLFIAHPEFQNLDEVESNVELQSVENAIKNQIYDKFKMHVINRIKADILPSLNDLVDLLTRLHPKSTYHAESDTVELTINNLIRDILNPISPVNSSIAFQKASLYLKLGMFKDANMNFMQVKKCSKPYRDSLFQCGHYHYLSAYNAETGLYNSNRLLLAKTYLNDIRLDDSRDARCLVTSIESLLEINEKKDLANKTNTVPTKLVNHSTIKKLSLFNECSVKHLQLRDNYLREIRLMRIEQDETVSEFSRVKAYKNL